MPENMTQITPEDTIAVFSEPAFSELLMPAFLNPKPLTAGSSPPRHPHRLSWLLYL